MLARMATRPRESISSLHISATGAAVLALLAFLLGYSMAGWGNVPTPAAATSTTQPPADVAGAMFWALLIALGWTFRERLQHWMLASRQRGLSLVLLAFVPVTVADAAAMQLSHLLWLDAWCAELLATIPPFHSFLPRAAILGGTTLLVLLAWDRHLAEQARRAAEAPPPARPASDWIDFPESPLLRVRAGDVALIRSAGNYSEIVAHGRVHLVRATLTELAGRLAPLGFVRVHRQTIINARSVRQICRDPAGRPLVHLASGAEIPVGRRYLDAIEILTAHPDGQGATFRTSGD